MGRSTTMFDRLAPFDWVSTLRDFRPRLKSDGARSERRLAASSGCRGRLQRVSIGADPAPANRQAARPGGSTPTMLYLPIRCSVNAAICGEVADR